MKISEIFTSINGEVSSQHQGSLCTFIRLAGCNLRCKWCDTSYAQDDKDVRDYSVSAVLNMVSGMRCYNVVITGGEPLLQWEELGILAKKLRYNNYNVSIETNGSIKIPNMNDVHWVVDWKLLSSGMSAAMKLENFSNLGKSDIVKFVVADDYDFEVAVGTITVMKSTVFPILHLNCPKFAFSPMGVGKSQWLIEKMKANYLLCRIGAIFSLQIHKIIWDPLKRKV
jgi:7-carboxy-7-deazaguanine synthase